MSQPAVDFIVQDNNDNDNNDNLIKNSNGSDLYDNGFIDEIQNNNADTLDRKI